MRVERLDIQFDEKLKQIQELNRNIATYQARVEGSPQLEGQYVAPTGGLELGALTAMTNGMWKGTPAVQDHVAIGRKACWLILAPQARPARRSRTRARTATSLAARIPSTPTKR